ncbi:MAG TPA: ribonuclease P protein component [Patescibacteria group bacterium]|jgi:ribonuclease P protein component|nr:ribonuclease P protein component [Patescibacteria group bacterium]
MQRRHRLRRAVDFDLLRREGRRWHHPLVLMVVRANGQQISRFGYSTGKRLGKATSRNRVKRLFREIVRRKLRELDSGWDCLFVVRNGAAEVSYVELEIAVNELLQRAGILNSTEIQELLGK